MTSIESEDRIVWRADLCRQLNVSKETIRRWLKAGHLPPPDISLSRRTLGWRLSTLRRAGINLP
ncbi:MerR family transcriptional regulator [Pelomicrobium methylotrophicum]